MQVVDEDVRGVFVLGVVLQHGGHGVVVGRVVLGSFAASASVRLILALPTGIEPEVIPVGEVDVRDVVHFVDGNCESKQPVH